jgi:hypothetical protein
LWTAPTAAGTQPQRAELSRVETTADQIVLHLTGPAAQVQLISTNPGVGDLAAIDWRSLKWNVRDLPIHANTVALHLPGDHLLRGHLPRGPLPGGHLPGVYYVHVTSTDGAVDSSVLFRGDQELKGDLALNDEQF